MDTETIIVLCMLAAIVVLPIAFVKLWDSPSIFTPVGHGKTTTSAKRETDVTLTTAEVLDEMCKMQSAFMVTRLARGRSLSQAEINVLRYKANPFHSAAFRVSETANQNEIGKWLKHPMVNHPWPDDFVMSMAAQTPIPVEMMERILKALLREDYDRNWQQAETRLRSKKVV